MNKIYIVGYMGAGKTTAARRIANHLGWSVVDTDVLFEEKYRVSVNDFFHKYDEPLFRRLESEILRSTENMENTVISTGGGTPCFNDNMAWMNQHGKTIFLRISPQAALDRLLHSKRKRPLVESKTETELAEYINVHYASRLPFYEQAAIVVKAENLDVENLIRLLENK